MILQDKNRAGVAILAVTVLLTFAALIYFHIGFDIAMIALLLASFWSIGAWLQLSAARRTPDRQLAQIACGMAVFGLLVYLLLLLGWGGKTQYVLLTLLPIAAQLYKRAKTGKPIRIPALDSFSPAHMTIICLGVLAFLLYLGYASAPIDKYDALTGHLPITMYAARNGALNLNICESQTYSQTGVLFYTYSTVLASFGAYKGLTLLNVALFALILATACTFARRLFDKTSSVCMVILFITVPMFFEFSTTFYVEMLPIYMAFSAFLLLVDLTPEQGWANMPYIALLFACAMISKMTIAYTLLFPGLLAIFLYWKDCLQAKRPLGRAILRFASSGLLFAGIVAVPYLLTWYWYGNPFYPMFNGVFRSVYFLPENFVDPFSTSPLTFSIGSLIKMVFQTNSNVEMYRGGLGAFLLLFPVIPVAWILARKKKLIIWGIIPLLAYSVSTCFTYNLRYYMAIFMLELVMTGISLSVIAARLMRRETCRQILLVALTVVISLPGLWIIETKYPVCSHLTQISDEISNPVYSDLFDEIPAGKHIFSSEPFKGDYDGTLTPNNWHGTAWKCVIAQLGISKEEFIGSFDYYICNMNSEAEVELLDSLIARGITLEPIKNSNGFTLYEIHSLNKTVLDTVLPTPTESLLSAPVTESFPVADNRYVITQDVENPNTESMMVRFQINWSDAAGNFLGTSITTYTLLAGERVETTSEEIIVPEGAVTGILYIGPHDDLPITVYGYSLESISGSDVLDLVEHTVTTRTLLKTK